MSPLNVIEPSCRESASVVFFNCATSDCCCCCSVREFFAAASPVCCVPALRASASVAATPSTE
jgi:hypothetical protein